MHADPASFLAAERESWRPYEALAGLSDEQLSVPLAAAHGWSGLDLMAHLIFWAERKLAIAHELAVGGTSASYARDEAEWAARGDVMNDEAQARWAARPMAEVRERFSVVFDELRTVLAVVPASRWTMTPEYSTLFPDETIGHYAMHVDDLAAVLTAARRGVGPGGDLSMLEQHALVVADAEGIIRIWSAGAEALFGHHAAEALGSSLDLLIPEAYRSLHWTAYHAAVASGVNHYEGAVFADPITHADGTMVHHRGRIALLKDAEGRVIGVISTWGPARVDDQGRTGPSVVARDVT